MNTADRIIMLDDCAGSLEGAMTRIDDCLKKGKYVLSKAEVDNLNIMHDILGEVSEKLTEQAAELDES